MEDYYKSQAGAGVNDYTSYYRNQTGQGVGSVYSGYGYQPQKGSGWFGQLLKGGIMPILSRILPYIGTKAADAVVGVSEDLKAGKSLKKLERDS